jgi:hypothetical protein
VIASRSLNRSREGGLSLEDWAAWATIIGTVIVVTGTVLGWLGKLRLRLPAQLESLESRALFVVCTVLVAMPIIAWGPLAGLLPSFANLLIVPSAPSYLEEYLKQPRSEPRLLSPAGDLPSPTVRQGIVFGLFAVLAVVNVIAVIRVIDAWMKSTR